MKNDLIFLKARSYNPPFIPVSPWASSLVPIPKLTSYALITHLLIFQPNPLI